MQNLKSLKRLTLLLFWLLLIYSVQIVRADDPDEDDDSEDPGGDDEEPEDTRPKYFVYHWPYLEHQCDIDEYWVDDPDSKQESCYYDRETNVSDPCIMYYDNDAYTICARCKAGAVRIFTEEGVFCGSVLNDDDSYYSENNLR